MYNIIDMNLPNRCDSFSLYNILLKQRPINKPIIGEKVERIGIERFCFPAEKFEAPVPDS